MIRIGRFGQSCCAKAEAGTSAETTTAKAALTATETMDPSRCEFCFAVILSAAAAARQTR